MPKRRRSAEKLLENLQKAWKVKKKDKVGALESRVGGGSSSSMGSSTSVLADSSPTHVGDSHASTSRGTDSASSLQHISSTSAQEIDLPLSPTDRDITALTECPAPLASTSVTSQSAALESHLPPPLLREELVKAIEDEDKKSYDNKFVITETQLNKLSSSVRCAKGNCRGKITIVANADRWDTDLELICNNCSFRSDVKSKKMKVKGRKHMQEFGEVNLEEVYHSLMSGIGQAGLRKKSGFIGKDFLSFGSYSRHCNFLYGKMNEHHEKYQKKAHEIVRNYYISRNIAQPDENGLIDIEVSFDGTWLTRGHKSHIGVGFVIEVYTGIIIDVAVLCNYCKVCDKGKKKHRCNKNYDGLAGAMEAEEARRLWERSVNHNFRYITFVGDGDSKAYNAVCEMNDGNGPYENIKVEKMECINHVHKRMGARLMRAKALASELITTKTGKIMKKSVLGGQKMLTQKVIENLQSYYGKAIRDNINTDVATLRIAIWASFFHLTSTDKNPGHHLCPKGSSSWCFYNRALANKETPPSHASKNLYLAKIPHEHLEHIKRVYRDLTEPSLLQRCLKGFTQNPNESIHARLWLKCPKVKFFGLYRVIFCAQSCVLEHNLGYERSNLLTELFGTSASIKKVLKTQDALKIKKQSPRVKKKASKTEISEEYKPGQF